MKRFTKSLLSGVLAAIMAATMISGTGMCKVNAEENGIYQGAIEQGVYDTSDSNAASEEVPVYRLYNPNSGEHFYTIHSSERDGAVSAGWRDEGIGWYAPASSKQPVYRMFNPNSHDAGSHHYTMSSAERDSLVASGWKYEGIVFYSGGQVKLFRSYNKSDGGHNYTPDYGEYYYINNLGWQGEGTGIYGVNADTNQGKMYTCKEVGTADGIKFATSSCISWVDYKKKRDLEEYTGSVNDFVERNISAAIYVSGNIDLGKFYIKWNNDEGYRNIGSSEQFIPDRAHPKVYFSDELYTDSEWLGETFRQYNDTAPHGYDFYEESPAILRYKYMNYKGYNKYIGIKLKLCSDKSQSYDIYYGNKKIYTLKVGASNSDQKCSGWLSMDMNELWLYKEIKEKTSYKDNMSVANLMSAADYCVRQHNYGGRYDCTSAGMVAILMACKGGYPTWNLYCGTKNGNDYNNFYSTGPYVKGKWYPGHVVSIVRYSKDTYIWIETQGSGLGYLEPWKPWKDTVKPASDSIYRKLDYLRDYDSINELMLGDFDVDITKYDPYDCSTWY